MPDLKIKVLSRMVTDFFLYFVIYCHIFIDSIAVQMNFNLPSVTKCLLMDRTGFDVLNNLDLRSCKGLSRLATLLTIHSSLYTD